MIMPARLFWDHLLSKVLCPPLSGSSGCESTFVIPYKNLLQVFTCSLTNVVITLDPFSIFLSFVNEQPFPSTPYKGTKEFRICIPLLEQLQLRFLFHIASSNLRYRIYFALISSRVSLFVSLCFGSKFPLLL